MFKNMFSCIPSRSVTSSRQESVRQETPSPVARSAATPNRVSPINKDGVDLSVDAHFRSLALGDRSTNDGVESALPRFLPTPTEEIQASNGLGSELNTEDIEVIRRPRRGSIDHGDGNGSSGWLHGCIEAPKDKDIQPSSFSERDRAASSSAPYDLYSLKKSPQK